jgi:hypothetical protein
MKAKHSKFKNTGILFELLVRQIASDVLSAKDSSSVKIIKKFFSNSELAKEHKLYYTIASAEKLSESKAESLINTVLDLSTKLNREQINKDKYNLIKEIKKNYDLDDFFKAKINNYKVLASISTLIESKNSKEFDDPKTIVTNKLTLLEHITKIPLTEEKIQSAVINEFTRADKDIRILAYKLLIEKFNDKYSYFSTTQKNVLKEFINNISNTEQLREFVNKNVNGLKAELQAFIPKLDDKTTQIKLNEILNLMVGVPKGKTVKDEHMISLLQYHELLDELKKVSK